MTYHIDADPLAAKLAPTGTPTCGVWKPTHDGYGGKTEVHCGRERGHEGNLHVGLMANAHPVQYTMNNGSPWALAFTLTH